MEIRGNRECADCGTRWSYYETGEVACPDCGSLRSVGRDDERRLHTDDPVTLDLSAVTESLADRPLAETADDVRKRCRRYRRRRGFVREGELLELDETYLVAGELASAIGEYDRSLASGALDAASDDEEQLYLLSLLGLDRPPADRVPPTFASARGLAYARAVEEYRTDALALLDATDAAEPDARSALGRLEDHRRRVEALDGAVEPETAERLVGIAREIGRYLREGDETALARAEDRLDSLG
jgi:hypothetical protein